MPNAFFRILRFEPDKGELELSQYGLEEPNARIAHCQWEEFGDGIIELDDGTKYEIKYLWWLIITSCSDDVYKQNWQKMAIE